MIKTVLPDLRTLEAAIDGLWCCGAGESEDDERRDILLKYIRDTHPDAVGKQ